MKHLPDMTPEIRDYLNKLYKKAADDLLIEFIEELTDLEIISNLLRDIYQSQTS